MPSRPHIQKPTFYWIVLITYWMKPLIWYQLGPMWTRYGNLSSISLILNLLQADVTASNNKISNTQGRYYDPKQSIFISLSIHKCFIYTYIRTCSQVVRMLELWPWNTGLNFTRVGLISTCGNVGKWLKTIWQVNWNLISET